MSVIHTNTSVIYLNIMKQSNKILPNSSKNLINKLTIDVEKASLRPNAKSEIISNRRKQINRKEFYQVGF